MKIDGISGDAFVVWQLYRGQAVSGKNDWETVELFGGRDSRRA